MRSVNSFMDQKGTTWKIWRGLCSNQGKDAEQEVFEDILTSGSLRIVRTVSSGQASGPYIQAEAEWVIVLQGSAELKNALGDTVELHEGDALFLPSGYEHTVSKTSDPCVWLCIYWSEATEEENVVGNEESEEKEGEVEVNELPLTGPLNASQEDAFREVVLSLRLVIHLLYANSLKDKRRVRQRLISALKKENVSVMEVARQDQHRELYLSIAAVSMGQEAARKLERRLVQLIHRDVSDGAYLQAYGVEIL